VSPGVVGLRERPWAVVLPWAFTALPALAVGLVAGEFVGSIWGHRIEGDWLLWKPGGFELLETARLLRREGEVLLVLGPWAVLAYSLLGLGPWGAAVVAFARPEVTGTAARLGRATEHLPALTFLYGLGLVGRILCALIGLAIAGLLAPAITGSNLRLEAAIKGAGVLVALGLMGVVRVWHDLAVAAAIRHRSGGREASITGLTVLRDRFARALFGWGARLAVAIVLVVLAAEASGALSLESVRSVAALLLMHQVILVALVVLRCGWLADAVHLVGRPLFADFLEENAEESRELVEGRGSGVEGEPPEAVLPPGAAPSEGVDPLFALAGGDDQEGRASPGNGADQ
jgi:hypothetical protein